MKWYVCPKCNVSSSTKQWDDATLKEYPGEIFSVADDEKKYCMYACPNCGSSAVYGNEINEDDCGKSAKGE